MPADRRRPGPKPRLESPIRFTASLPAAMVEELDAVAETLNRSRAEVLRCAVERGLPGLDAAMFRGGEATINIIPPDPLDLHFALARDVERLEVARRIVRRRQPPKG